MYINASALYKALRRSLMKLSQKLQPVQQAHNAAEETDGVRVEELLLLVDTMVEEAENRTQVRTHGEHHGCRIHTAVHSATYRGGAAAI